MARIRTIKPEFWTDEDLSSISAEAALLAIALLNYADDEGYFKAHPGLVRAGCMPLRDTLRRIAEMLTELVEIGYLRLGTGPDGKRYGHIVSFLKHQRISHPAKSQISELSIAWDAFTEDSGGTPEERRNHPESLRPEMEMEQGNGIGTGNRTQMDVSCSSQESISVVETHTKRARVRDGRDKRGRVCEDDGLHDFGTHHQDAGGDDPTPARDQCGHVLAATDEICGGTDGHRTGQSGGDHVTDTHRTMEGGGDDVPSQADHTPARNTNPGTDGPDNGQPEEPDAKTMQRSSRHATDNRRSPGRSAKRTVADEDFEFFWTQHPRRDGTDSKAAAHRAWGARIRDGTRPEEMISGVMAYAQHCDRKRLTGTPYVMQAATFLGPDLHFRNDWRKPNGAGCHFDPDDEQF